MYGNFIPNPQNNLDRINKQIEDLVNMKNQYQNAMQPAQAPIQNIINANNTSISDFEARYLKDDETYKIRYKYQNKSIKNEKK